MARSAKTGAKMRHWPHYDYGIVNRDIEESVENVAAISPATVLSAWQISLADFVNRLPLGPRTLEYALLAEELGFRAVWCPEVPAFGRDVWVTLARIRYSGSRRSTPASSGSSGPALRCGAMSRLRPRYLQFCAIL